MQLIPGEILERYLAVLERRAVPASRQAEYKKWLRYFLDFEAKYRPPDSRSEQVRLFIQKLREKKQTPEQQKQAAHAISLYFESRVYASLWGQVLCYGITFYSAQYCSRRGVKCQMASEFTMPISIFLNS